jgi:NADPH-dependent ferric siderophore reductase
MTGPTPSPAPGRRVALAARVVRVERLSPSFVRVVLGGPGLAPFVPSRFADSYVKLAFLDPRTPERLPVDGAGRLDLAEVRALCPPDAAPRLRAYTVRAWDDVARELTLDVVVHGVVGLGGPWAQGARPGDAAWVVGPGGAWSPEPLADHHLLVGDESALPAIAVAVERLPAGARARVLVEVPGPADELPLAPAAGAAVDVTWLHRGRGVVGTALVAATRALDSPAGRTVAFVHGEAGFVAELRRHLRIERLMPREDLSISGYWRLGVADEGWRATKRDWAAELDASERGAGLT